MFDHPRERQLSAVNLTQKESSGSTAMSYFAVRHSRLPASWVSPWRRFLDPGSNITMPSLPSDRRAGPPRSGPARRRAHDDDGTPSPTAA
jgi:hypothetical protein